MSPKEFAFFCNLIEETAKAAYTLGHADGKADKPLNTDAFRMNTGNKLVLKREINSLTKKR